MYEKNGWTGDGMLGADMMLRNVDAETLLSKWVQDIADARNADGAPLLIAPNPGWGDVRAPPWHAAYVLVPWSLYWQRGDRRVLADHVDGMARYVDLEYARSPGGIADTALGDWVSPNTPADGGNAPEDKRIAATAYLYRMADVMAQIEHVLGNDDKSRHFDAMAARVRAAFNQQFFDSARGLYRGQGDDGVRQTHQLLALGFGLVPTAQRARVVDALVQAVHAHDDHLDTGALAPSCYCRRLRPPVTPILHGSSPLRRAFPVGAIGVKTALQACGSTGNSTRARVGTTSWVPSTIGCSQMLRVCGHWRRDGSVLAYIPH
jgi:alpha-L-rhamnosidase